MQPDPAAARVVRGDRPLPHRDRHPPRRRAAPRHQDDLQPIVLAAVEDGPVEVEDERHLAVVERVHVLRRGHLEVVRAGHVERERRRARERGYEAVDARPLERGARSAPALRRTEELDEALTGRVVVGAPRRLDLDLRRQRDRVDLEAVGLGDVQMEADAGGGRVLDRLGAEDGELEHGPARSAARRRSSHVRGLAYLIEEALHRRLHRRASADPLPRRLDQSDEPVAVVERRDHVGGRDRTGG